MFDINMYLNNEEDEVSEEEERSLQRAREQMDWMDSYMDALQEMDEVYSEDRDKT